MPVEEKVCLLKVSARQEDKPCSLLEGSKISVSISREVTGSKKNELDELVVGRSSRHRCRKLLTHR